MSRERRGQVRWLLAAAFASACATAKPPAPKVVVAPPPPKPAPVARKLAWMPLETRASPEIANVVNERFAHASVAGVTETFQASVSMEMAQLAIECIEHTPKCYAAVGRHVGADELLWAELSRSAKRDAGVTLRVSRLDVASSAVVKQEARTFPTVKAARAGVPELVDSAVGAGGEAGGPSP
jgi:hypothetical protein